MDNLAEKIQVRVLRCCDAATLAFVSICSQRFREVSEKPGCWRKLVLTTFDDVGADLIADGFSFKQEDIDNDHDDEDDCTLGDAETVTAASCAICLESLRESSDGGDGYSHRRATLRGCGREFLVD